ncbi:MAG: zinc ribbon domain-containing protein [Anaerolineales bacterium]|nr:MAG: zinc ribbon domain-containing protein [Anaerolineales bacterium]
MPVYTYRCDNCGHEFDRQQSFEDSPLKVCPECRKHTLNKVYRAAGVVFKGSGFYVTDKSRKAASPAPTNGKKAKETTSTSSGTEAKGETKTEKPTAKPKSDD